jgi:rubrerythrin
MNLMENNMTSKPRSCYTEKGKPKYRFNTRAEAKQWIRDLLERYPENVPLEPYRCEHCGFFHNGRYPNDPIARAGKRARHRAEVNS